MQRRQNVASYLKPTNLYVFMCACTIELSNREISVSQADETTEALKIPRSYHPSLIGQGGKYVVRLEDKYDVKITFPRDGQEAVEGRRDVPKPDEVIVRGPRKGVAHAKAELLEVCPLRLA